MSRSSSRRACRKARATPSSCRRSRQSCERLADMVAQASMDGKAPAGARRRSFGRRRHGGRRLARFMRKKRQKLGLIWIDAHADMNTPNQPQRQRSRHAARLLHRPGTAGTDAYVRLRAQSGPANVALVGMRDVDLLERQNVRESGVTRLHHARYRRAGHARGHGEGASSSPRATPPASISRSIWISSIPNMRPASARRCAAASPIAKRTSPWR